MVAQKRTLSSALALAVVALSMPAIIFGDPSGAQPRRPPAQTRKPAPPPKRSPQVVPFAPGETLTFDVSWSSYVTAATASLKVVERKPSYGSEAYYIVAEGQPTSLVSKLYDLSYKLDTLLDVYTLLPQRGSVFSKEGRRQRMKITMFNHGARRAKYEVQTRTNVQKDVSISAYAQDVLGALYVVRAIPFKTGEKFSIPICDAGESYTVQVIVGSVETITTGIGAVRAFKLTPVLPASHGSAARRLTLWLSEDARRLPVRMQAQLPVGTFDLTLRSAAR